VSVQGDLHPPRALLQLYYMAFLIGRYTCTTSYVVVTDKHGRLLHQCSGVLHAEPDFSGRKHGPD
jgi:hypothetical protein